MFCFSVMKVEGMTVCFVELNLMCQRIRPSVRRIQILVVVLEAVAQNISGYLYSTAHQCNPVSSLNYTLQCEVNVFVAP